MEYEQPEYVELAAVALGLQEHGWIADSYMHVVNNTWCVFDPLHDSGTALWLAVKLNIRLGGFSAKAVNFSANPYNNTGAVLVPKDGTLAPLRLAITIAASRIGRAKLREKQA